MQIFLYKYQLLKIYFNLREFTFQIEQWCKEAGKDVTFEYIVKNPVIKSTKLDDDSVPFWGALIKAVEAMQVSKQSLYLA